MSNRLEVLFNHLKKNIFYQSAPFSKRIVVVPSKPIEEWISLKLAEDPEIGICCGVSFFFLNPFLRFCGCTLPSKLTLILKIEEEIEKILSEEKNETKWSQLVQYLKGKPKRAFPLYAELASLFLKYGIYGRELPQKEWQIHLWNRLLKKEDFDFASVGSISREVESVHIFSFNHIPQKHLQFFEKIGASCPTFFYALSPCKEFWSDMVTEKKRTRIYRDNQKVQEYYPETHSLLANLGKLGREQSILFEEKGWNIYEAYLPSSDTTQLGELQRDMLHLTPPSLKYKDTTIQIHQAPTRLREVEILYQLISEHIQEGGTEPRDFLVMAPDISMYAPYIRTVFSGKILAQVCDMPAKTQNVHLLALYDLFGLEQNRWSAPFVLNLLNSPPLKQKMRWGVEELAQLKEWTREAEIHWGLDHHNQNALLKHCPYPLGEGPGSWWEGFDRLLHRLASSQYGKPIDLTLCELLEEYMNLLYRLQKTVLELKEPRSLTQWCSFIEHVDQSYFAGFEDDRKDLTEKLNRLRKEDENRSNAISFSFFRSLLEEFLFDEGYTVNRNQLQAVHFSSLLPARSIPAKVVCLMGMNDSTFPRRDNQGALDLFNHIQSDYCPSKIDFDRYLFLEAILSARESFIITFTEKPLSSVIYEMYSVTQSVEIVEHPAFSFDPQYFDDQIPELRNSSQDDYTIASLLMKTEKDFQFTPLYEVSEKVVQPQMNLTLGDLFQSSRYPFQHYIKKTLGISFIEDKVLQEDENFLLSPLYQSYLHRVSLKKPVDSLVEEEIALGRFPGGVFKEIACTKLRESIPPRLESSSLELPPLEVELEHTLVKIHGTIDGISPAGLVTIDKYNLKGIVRVWPLFLVLNCMIPNTPLYFAREGKVVPWIGGEPVEALKHYLSYYFSSLNTPSYLYPEWVEFFLKEDIPGLAKKLASAREEGFGKIYDKGFEWTFRCQPPPDASYLMEVWHKKAVDLYGEVARAHF